MLARLEPFVTASGGTTRASAPRRPGRRGILAAVALATRAAGRPCRRPGAPRPRGTRAPTRPTHPDHPRPRDGDRAGAVAGRATRRLRVGAHAVARDPGAPARRRIPDRGGEGERSSPAVAIVVARRQPHHVRPHRAASRSCPHSAGRRVSSCRTRRIRTTHPWGSSGLAHAWRVGRRTGNPSPSSGATRLYLQDLASGSPRMVAQGGQMHSLAWSPDGRWIACVLGNRQAQQPGFLFANGGAATLGLIPASGGEPKPLSEDAYYSASPVLGARWQIVDLYFQSGRRSGPLPDAAPAGRQTRGGAITAHQWPPGALGQPRPRWSKDRILGFRGDVERVFDADPGSEARSRSATPSR